MSAKGDFKNRYPAVRDLHNQIRSLFVQFISKTNRLEKNPLHPLHPLHILCMHAQTSCSVFESERVKIIQNYTPTKCWKTLPTYKPTNPAEYQTFTEVIIPMQTE